jgi:hypothetical protein
METTVQEFEKLQSLRKQLKDLENTISSQSQVVIQSASNDFAEEIGNLKSVINKSFTKAKLVPAPFGFIVTSPDFKKLGGKTNIRKKIAETAGSTTYVNTVNTDYYYESHIPKEIRITLAKAFIQRKDKSYKNILDGIEIA